MATSDKINNLPVNLGSASTGHTANHDVIHQALKELYARHEGAVAQHAGVGFPEGKVSAPVGATYTDTAATNGAIRWIKTSGTGNTGWRVEYGDTGWRNVSSELADVLESGKVFFRRKNDTVDIAAEWAKFIPTGSSQMPAGFRPFRNDGFPFYASANLATPVAQFRIGYSGTITINVFDNRYSANDQGTLTTSDPWPTSLPGTPV